jgi:hexokinase
VPFIAQIREHCKELQLSDTQISEMMNRLLEDIQLGLGKDTHKKSIVKCFVTYVQDLPNGTGKL